MSIRAFLQGLGATHLFTLSNEGTNTADDLGNSVDPTRITGGSYSFEPDPVCEGVTHSLESTSAANTTTRTDGAILDNRADINGSNGAGNDSSVFDYVATARSLHLWFKANQIDAPTCIYEQGGGANNFAIVLGVAKAITFQAADAGQPFLIAQSKFLAQVNRAYFIVGVWQHHTNHAGAGNRVLFYINGVLQESVELDGIANFPAHGGDVTIGNSAESLKFYNEATMPYAVRTKNINLLGMYNNVVLTEAQCRSIFERTVKPQVTIAADTVANQQAALDALIGNSYEDLNCAIRIIQATDATDYRLFIDNISFTKNENLNDIAIQYVGSNVLTLENANGSNVDELSAPVEVDLDGTNILAGGGSITLVEDTVRVNALADQSNINATKIVIEQAGSYVFTSVNVSELENVSGGVVEITSDKVIPVITNTGAGSSTVILGSFLSFTGVDSWKVFATLMDRNMDINPIGTGLAGETYPFMFAGGVTYYIKAEIGNTSFLIEETPTIAGETKVELMVAALLAAKPDLDEIVEAVTKPSLEFN